MAENQGQPGQPGQAEHSPPTGGAETSPRGAASAVSRGETPPAAVIPATEAPGRIDTVERPAPLPRVAGFELLAVLGGGGMGIVYRARQLAPERIVALKMIRAAEFASDDALARFQQEIQAVARLSHPNIVQLHEIGQDEGRPYFTMECLNGGSLLERLKQETFPFDEAARLVQELARAIQHAHERGIVHRDLKPANVLLSEDGRPKITDFGLAKWVAEGSRLQTQSGAMLGTPDYMAPEQALGDSKRAGPAADVYSLGVILYEMIAGQRPFGGEDILRQILNDDPPSPAWLRPSLPRDLETICLKCLRKDPPRRYATAGDLADDLGRFLAGSPIVGRRPSLRERLRSAVRRRPRTTLTIAAATLLMCAALGGAWYAVAYAWPYDRHFELWVNRWGVPEGIGPLRPSAVGQRAVSYRLTRRGRLGPVTAVSVVNSRGDAIVDSSFRLWVEGIREDLPSALRECRIEFDYDPDGRVREERGLDLAGSLLWRCQLTYPDASSGDPRRVARAQFVDAQGNIVTDAGGVTSVRFIRSAEGRDVRVDFLDARGNPRRTADGYYSQRIGYDDTGRVAQAVNLDAEGLAAANYWGVAIIRMTYDEADRLVETQFFDPAGNPTLHLEGYHRQSIEYDERGNVTFIRYWDVEEKPARATADLAANRMEYDSAGFMTLQDGLLTSGDVSIRIRYERDDAGAQVRTVTEYFSSQGLTSKDVVDYDRFGNKVRSQTWDGPGAQRLAETATFEYNAQHRLQRETVCRGDSSEVLRQETSDYDARGRKTSLRVSDAGTPDAAWLTRWHYDDLGRVAREEYFARDETTLLSARAFEYEAQSRQRREETHIESDGKSLSGRIRWQYNGQGRVLVQERFDAADQPQLGTDPDQPVGARVDYVYDDFGRLTEKRHSGFAAELAFAGILERFDAHGREIETLYLDRNGQPTARGNEGWIGRTRERDAFGLLTRTVLWGFDGKYGHFKRITVLDNTRDAVVTTYYDENDRQVRHSDGNLEFIVILGDLPEGLSRRRLAGFDPQLGYDAIEETYDRRGRIIERTHLGSEGRLTAGPEGFARECRTHDEERHRWVYEYFDADGQPTPCKDGNRRYELQYSDDGETLRQTLLSGYDPSAGFDHSISLYDENGRLAEYAYFDASGNRIAGPEGFARSAYENDSVRNRRVQRFFDADDRPIRLAEGYSYLETALSGDDARSELTAGGFDADCGYSRRTIRFDVQGRMVERKNLDDSDQLVMPPGGPARIVCEYDAGGQLSRVIPYDSANQPLEASLAVVITAILPGTQAERLGLQVGDLFRSFAGVPVSATLALSNEMKRADRQRGPNTAVIERNGQTIEVTLEPGILGVLWEDRLVRPPPAAAPPQSPHPEDRS